MKVSVVYVTFNESKKLKRSLDSVKDFASEIVIVDLGSSDGVEDVAKEFQAKVYNHEKVPYVELIRSYAISKANGSWVMILDPDEVVSKSLVVWLKKLINNVTNTTVAVNIPRKNIFFGKWIRHTNFWPDRQIRFFQKDLVAWPKRIHIYPIVRGLVVDLPADPNLALQHFGYDNYSDFWQRQKRYSTIEASNLHHEGIKGSIFRLIWSPLKIFLVRFIKHQGFIDGTEGLFLIFGLMYFSLVTEIKLLKLETK